MNNLKEINTSKPLLRKRKNKAPVEKDQPKRQIHSPTCIELPTYSTVEEESNVISKKHEDLKDKTTERLRLLDELIIPIIPSGPKLVKIGVDPMANYVPTLKITSQYYPNMCVSFNSQEVSNFLDILKHMLDRDPIWIENIVPIALLSGTLRTYQRAGCDDEVVTLRCPPGTSISIELAQYGKSAPSKSLCGPKTAQSSVIKTSYSYNVTCLWPNSLQTKWKEVTQGTWGRTVVEACQKKAQCKFTTSPKTFGGDPCPGTRKYVEVAYKCRPYEFRTKMACQNERIQLKCNPNSRVAVYSASYGRTQYESFQCPQPQGVPEETCLVSYATETVMQLCHGKRSCELSADVSTFGSPCKPESRMYLKVVYTCVPRKVLKELYEDPLEPDEIETDLEFSNDDEDDFETYDSAGNEYIRESAASPPAPNIETIGKNINLTKNFIDVRDKNPAYKANGLDFAPFQPYTSTPRINLFRPSRVPATQKPGSDMQVDDIRDPNCTITVYAAEKTRVVGFISEWINAYTFVSQNQERFYLYLIVSIATGLLLCLIILVSRLLLQRHRARREAKFHATNIADHSLPNGFTDDISEVDADIDLTTPLPTVAVHSAPVPVGSIAEVVRYPHVHAHTLRRPIPDGDMPRSLSSASNTQYYYYG